MFKKSCRCLETSEYILSANIRVMKRLKYFMKRLKYFMKL